VTRIGEPARQREDVTAGDSPPGGRAVPIIASVLAFIASESVVRATGFGGLVDHDRLRQWSTVFLALVLQALPFLVLGTVLAGLVAA
jgi:hypothetical protein